LADRRKPAFDAAQKNAVFSAKALKGFGRDHNPAFAR
jgi:hypothetical protein